MANFPKNQGYGEDPYIPEEDEYDDGFDELLAGDEMIPEMSEEEIAERKEERARLAFGAGNLFVIIAGTVAIIILLSLLFSMIHFLVGDINRNFSLFQTNF